MHDPDILLNVHQMIAAPTGGGKSYLAGSMIEALYQAKKPFVVLDTKNQNHAGLLKLKKTQLLRIDPGKNYKFRRALDAKFLIVVPSTKIRTPELIEQYRHLLEALYDAKIPRTVLIEEAHLYNPHGNVADPLLELIAREGRGMGQNLIFVDQRLQQFPKILWSQCKISWVLKMLIPHDIRYVECIIPDFPKINADLQPHDVIKYNHSTNQHTLIKADQVTRITPHLG